MAIADFPGSEEHRRAGDNFVAPGADRYDGRSRDANGHCWDGLPCDHPAHFVMDPAIVLMDLLLEENGPIHLMH
jgi:hypothetical protein